MYFKTIIQGRLTFSNQKSYDKVVKMYEYRAETYYKSDVLLKIEDIFDETNLTLSIPRYVGNASEKAFKNTANLLEYCAQFAVSGSINAWMINEGKITNKAEIEPESDKAVVQAFQRGKSLFQEGGKETEAIEAFTKTLEKYERHGQAYERRGWINIRLKNYSDALYDFNKAIALDDSIAYAYYGKALIAQNEGNHQEAVDNFELTLKKAVALQPIYWQARLKKAVSHIELEEWPKAAFDLKFFTNRNFKSGDKNLLKKPYAYYLYGRVLYEQGEFQDALEALNKALDEQKEEGEKFDEKEGLFYRALVKIELGKKDYKSDLKKSADLGYSPAVDKLSK